jgi:hypothetical protein
MFFVSHTRKCFLLIGPHIVLSLLVDPIAEGSMIMAVADIYAGCQADCVDCLKLGVRNAVPNMMTSHLVSLLVMLAAAEGLLYFFPPALYVVVVSFVAGPAIVLENVSVSGILKRSYNLVSGDWCYVLRTL